MPVQYESLNELNKAQMSVMRFMQEWVHDQKTPIPLKDTLINMEKRGLNKKTVIYSISVLLKLGYIRRAHTISTRTSFVQLRRV